MPNSGYLRNRPGKVGAPVSLPDDVTVSGLVVRPREHVVVVRGHELEFTPREFGIVMKLVAHPGWVFSAEQLSVDDELNDYSPESVSVLVSRLRRKFAHVGALDVIETVRGVGYRLQGSRRSVQWPTSPEEGLPGALHDASWHVQEAVIEVDRTGTDEQKQAALDALEKARAAIHEALGT